ncbi:MAG: MoxR family ATPase [Chitinophagales bacterium]|nr:MoxR family ATPase [Chitinophagales bacterium]MCZ2392817.1 MoxR family ATPase [Chitinophagales bacterium]
MFQNDIEGIQELKLKYHLLKEEVGKVIVGQNKTVELVLLSILCDSHSLLVGVPGLAKTLLVKTIAQALDLKYKRIQFTPDLMPSDIIGTEILDGNNFRFIQGPIFANIILADEINRTPPKTQAALLEAMQERTVTVGGLEYRLDLPFFVLATQNPIEQEGTYPLPEAQLDRFMFNIQLDYPSIEEEYRIVKQTTISNHQVVNKILSKEEIIAFQDLIKKIPVTDSLIEYAVNLIASTRPNSKNPHQIINEYISWGAGPRASQAIVLAAKAYAAIHGKFSPDIEDVKAVCIPILRHRIIRNFKAEAEDVSLEQIVSKIM